MINHKHKFIFIGIGKNASSSINRFFQELGAPLLDGQHSGVADLHYYLKVKHKQYSSDYFSFAFVRNPYSRLFSAYQEFKRPEQFLNIKKALRSKSFKGFFLCLYRDFNQQNDPDRYNRIRYCRGSNIQRLWCSYRSGVLPEEVGNFTSFVKMTMLIDHTHWEPQVDILFYQGKPLVDFIGRFENLEHDLKFVSEKIGLKTAVQVKTIRASNDQDYLSAYNKETAAIVAKRYAKDFAYFGYRFEL